MAIYRIFPEKDAFISSESPSANTGKDEILEIGGYRDLAGDPRTLRTLVKFDSDQISNIINEKIGNTNFNTFLHLYLAEASELPVDFKIHTYPVYGSWDQGKGKFNDIPTDTSGVSWEFKNAGGSNFWNTLNFAPGTTGSFYPTQQGGGNWYTGSYGINLDCSQSFTPNSQLDLNVNVTPIVKLFYSSSIPNDGFIVKLEDSLESQISSSIRLRYFSRDTNTIYPPYLEFKWNDSQFITGSLQVLNSTLPSISFSNLRKEYIDEGKQRLRIVSRPKYPPRVFSTSSAYLINYALPEESYWGLKDEHSEEMIVDFDNNYTKISCDSNGSFFDIYMDTLQPERYYKLLIKTEIDGSSVVVDNKSIFKVVRNG